MTYPSKPSSAPAIPFNSVGKSKVLNDIISAIGVEKLLALKTDGTYDDNFSIGDNSLNSLVNEINIRQGSTIKEYDSTGANLLRTLTLGSATNLVQGFRYLDEPIKISNNATNPLTEIDISAGIMNFDDGTDQVRLTTSLTKSTANDFANGGLLPNGTVLQTNTMYHVFAIYSSSSNLVSFYADANYSNPTLPQSPNVYDKKQHIGYFSVNSSGNIIGFNIVNGFYQYEDPKLFYSANIQTSNARTINQAFTQGLLPAKKVMIRGNFLWRSDGGSSGGILFTDPNLNDVSASDNTGALSSLMNQQTLSSNVNGGQFEVVINNAGEFRARATSSGSHNERMSLVGFYDNIFKY